MSQPTLVADGPYAGQDTGDFHLTGPGTLAGDYLRRFWHPVRVGRDLVARRPVPVRALHEDLTLYRGDDGVAHAVAFRCAHRGEQLSLGTVEGDCIRCFYHGWKYDAGGQCVEAPAETPRFAQAVRIRSYPVTEHLGLVFAYVGSGPPPPFPRYHDLDEGERVMVASSYVRGCNYFNAIDNDADDVHASFVHKEGAAAFEELNVGIPTMSAEETDWGLDVRVERDGAPIRINRFCMPLALRFESFRDERTGHRRISFAWHVPIDDVSHQTYFTLFGHAPPEAAERMAEVARSSDREMASMPSRADIADAILAGRMSVHTATDLVTISDPVRHDVIVANIQDDASQIGQGLVADRRNERLGRSDAALIVLRRIWARELAAVAANRAPKQWRDPSELPRHAEVTP